MDEYSCQRSIKKILQSELKLYTGMNSLVYDGDENWNSE